MSTPPLVVVGAGVAGLSAALAAAPRPVILVSRGDGRESSTRLAQGGIAAAVGLRDSPDLHAADTLAAGGHRNDMQAVRWLCAEAPAAIGWLQRLGMDFDRDGPSLRLAREGGHQRSRIVHAGGDATGLALLHTLRRAVLASAHLRDWWQGDCDALLLRGGRVAGVRVRAAGGSTRVCDDASAVVLATGGVGALFPATTQPSAADGAGLALGMAAGAAARDLDRLQFHPTALDLPGEERLPLVSEAVRGAGARLVDRDGRPLMAGVHPMGDLAPRDVVARIVAEARADGRGALLDATAIGAAWPARFPGIFQTLMAYGIDPRSALVPVREAMHFHMGGLATDLDGRTSLPGLLAVGEVACNGVHGANRLASNSLLEGIVFGRRLGLRQSVAMPVAASGPESWEARGPGLSCRALRPLRHGLGHALGPLRHPRRYESMAVRVRRMHWENEGWQGRLALAMLEAAMARESASSIAQAAEMALVR